MMKFFGVKNEADREYFVGSVKEIKALYKAMNRASKKGNLDMCPAFRNAPKFSRLRSSYALCVDYSKPQFVTFQIVGADTFVNLLTHCEIQLAN